MKLGTNLQVAYFDQLRDTLDDHRSVADNVGEGGEHVVIGGTKKHIYGYLQDFLFTPERARTEVRFLSGGERNRVLLAKLMTRPANVIVLDEPTNDLDSETLELLEEQLLAFDGTVLMVSHDRAFLNSVIGSLIVFERISEDLSSGNPQPMTVREYIGGYDDYAERKRQAIEEAKAEKGNGKQSHGKSKSVPEESTAAQRKLSYNEQRELKQLPEKIEKLESSIASLHDLMSKPDYYQSDKDVLATDAAKLKTLETDLADAYERWEQLES